MPFGCLHSLKLARYKLCRNTEGLPTELKLRWSAHTGNLTSVMRQFQDALAQYEGLWNELAEFDKRAWVLEPTEDMWSGTCTGFFVCWLDASGSLL